jgi:hypothetical protein
MRYTGHGEESILDLAANYYFGLDDENQRRTLVEFIRAIWASSFVIIAICFL